MARTQADSARTWKLYSEKRRGLGLEPASFLLYGEINYCVSHTESQNLVIFYCSIVGVEAKKGWIEKSKAHGNN